MNQYKIILFFISILNFHFAFAQATLTGKKSQDSSQYITLPYTMQGTFVTVKSDKVALDETDDIKELKSKVEIILQSIYAKKINPKIKYFDFKIVYNDNSYRTSYTILIDKSDDNGAWTGIKFYGAEGKNYKENATKKFYAEIDKLDQQKAALMLYGRELSAIPYGVYVIQFKNIEKYPDYKTNIEYTGRIKLLKFLPKHVNNQVTTDNSNSRAELNQFITLPHTIHKSFIIPKSHKNSLEETINLKNLESEVEIILKSIYQAGINPEVRYLDFDVKDIGASYKTSYTVLINESEYGKPFLGFKIFGTTGIESTKLNNKKWQEEVFPSLLAKGVEPKYIESLKIYKNSKIPLAIQFIKYPLLNEFPKYETEKDYIGPISLLTSKSSNSITSQQEAKSVVNSNSNSTSIKCNYVFVKPAPIKFKLVDNRRICDCCNDRYVQYEKRLPQTIEGEKAFAYKAQIMKDLKKHINKVNASDEHMLNDWKRLDQFLKKNYPNLKYHEGMFSTNGFVFAATGVVITDIDLYENSYKYSSNPELYCSKKCYVTCK